MTQSELIKKQACRNTTDIVSDSDREREEEIDDNLEGNVLSV